MTSTKFDFSARGRSRVVLFTVLGTLLTIAASFTLDSYQFDTGTWGWGNQAFKNALIPLVIAPPFLVFLLSKLRELAIAHHELNSIASTDMLTSLLNRRAFTAVVDGYIERMARQTRPQEGAFLVIDIDYFKRINDRFGHSCGDEALEKIAHAIQDAVRAGDAVGRIGGEEFAVLLPGVDQAGAEIMAERIRTKIHETRFAPSGEPYDLTASVGGVTFDRVPTYNDLFRGADEMLYVAKRTGRDRVDITELHPVAKSPAKALH